MLSALFNNLLWLLPFIWIVNIVFKAGDEWGRKRDKQKELQRHADRAKLLSKRAQTP